MRNSTRKILENNSNVQELDYNEKEDLFQEFDLYTAESLWKDWMNNYTEAEEGEDCTEEELEKIENEEARIFLDKKFN